MQSIYTLQRKTEIADRLQEAIILVDFRAGPRKAAVRATEELEAFIADSLSINFENVIKAIYEAVDTVEPTEPEPQIRMMVNYIIFGEEHPNGKEPFYRSV